MLQLVFNLGHIPEAFRKLFTRQLKTVNCFWKKDLLQILARVLNMRLAAINVSISASLYLT